jgi:hypothetical protein
MKTTFCLIFCIILLSGCAGGKCRITAKSVVHPVSCTPCVFDSAGRIRTAQSADVVEHFEISKTRWTMFWTACPLNGGEWDISNEINAKLNKSPGNAIVNVRVKVRGCDFLNWYLAALVPIIPSYVHMDVQGDIVRIPDAPK